MKDFDFNPEYSTSDLVGAVAILRELADTKLWKKRPFDPAHALVDLHLIANNTEGEWKAENGGTVAYRAGWCIWSNRGLAERWGWRQESVESFLKQLEEIGVIRRHATGQRWRAIELVHWRSMDGASPEHDLQHERSMDGDGGSRSRELGEGVGVRGGGGEEEEKHFPEQVNDEAVIAFGKSFKGEVASGAPEMPEEWVFDFLKRLNGRREWPRDWRSYMVSCWRSEFRAWAGGAAKKNAARPAGDVSASVVAIQQQRQKQELQRELRELEDEVEQDRQSNIPVTSEKREKLKKLRAELESKQ